MSALSITSRLRSIVTQPRSGARARLLDLFSLHRQRTRLGELDARMLDDIGVSARDAKTESQRPVWDVPANWRR